MRRAMSLHAKFSVKRSRILRALFRVRSFCHVE
jgi:hypothetical protein